MRRFQTVPLVLPVLLTLAGCSQQEPASYESSSQANQAEDAVTPDIGVSAAPGVAFSYDYRFGLDSGKIASLQERHAAACEALGLAKCRITGLRFSRYGADRAGATLELALAPDLARSFGKDAMAAVEAAKGAVTQIEIAGVDQNPALKNSDRQGEAARAERARLETQLADSKLPDATRAELVRQIAAQKTAEQAAQAQGEAARDMLATTPMRFTYSTDGFLPGISLDRTARAALSFAVMLLNALFALVVVLGVLAIPLGLILLAFAHGRKGAQWLWRKLAPEPEEG